MVSEDPPSSAAMSTYSKELPIELTRRKVFEENFYHDAPAPKNLIAIQNAIDFQDGISSGVGEATVKDYVKFCQAITRSGINEVVMARDAFDPYFNLHSEFESAGKYAFAMSKKWIDYPEPKIDPKPSPDYFEGLSTVDVPEWVDKHLERYATPVPEVAFPNFLAEIKSEGSMRIGHTQCRLDGAFAARGYYALHGLYSPADIALNTAFVGTIEFNGEICIGNVHWMTKCPKGELEYRMKRVFCVVTRGLGVEDFVKGRGKARNFRSYFAGIRLEHLRKLESLPVRAHPPNYKRQKVPELREELKKRKLATRGHKEELIKRLEQADFHKNAEGLVSLMETVDNTHLHSQGSNLSPSFEHAEHSDQGHSFRSQKRTREEDDPNESQSQLSQKRTREN